MNRGKEYEKVLNDTLQYAKRYINNTDKDNVCADKSLEELRENLYKPLNIDSIEPEKIIEELVHDVDGGLLNNTGGRFFAWVIGGSVPAALAADWLTSTWDQNAALYACSPAEAVIEEIVGQWLKTLLGLPQKASYAITTGCQMAHVTCLAAARNQLLARQSWDVESMGLAGAPKIHILTNSNLHVSVERAARFLGLGSDSVVRLEVNQVGQLKTDSLKEALEKLKGEPVILQLCAGDINTGMYDDFNEIIPIAHSYNAWVHIDGAFGLWVNASEKYKHYLDGVEKADSWATDGHKWLNVPYDCGYAFVSDSNSHKASMSIRASYLTHAKDARDQFDWNPEWSRRGRGVSTYAAIRQMGTKGISDLIDKSCKYANDLVVSISNHSNASIAWKPRINQGLIQFISPKDNATQAENDAFTDMIIEKINLTGKLFVGGTNWKGKRCMRISVCGWQTDEQDVSISLKAVDEVLNHAITNNEY